VRHAGPDALDALDDLIVQLRGIDGLTEKKPGVFYRGSRAFLHFHDDQTGLYADVRLGDGFNRHRVTTKGERSALIRLVRSALA
jgi:hypothetical protein